MNNSIIIFFDTSLNSKTNISEKTLLEDVDLFYYIGKTSKDGDVVFNVKLEGPKDRHELIQIVTTFLKKNDYQPQTISFLNSIDFTKDDKIERGGFLIT